MVLLKEIYQIFQEDLTLILTQSLPEKNREEGNMCQLILGNRYNLHTQTRQKHH